MLLPLILNAKVHYLDIGSEIPEGAVSAVEARVSLSAARAGRLAKWTLGWGTDSITLTFDCRNMVEGIGEPVITVRAAGEERAADDMNFNGGYNSVAVEWEGGNARILAGDERLLPVMTVGGLNRPEGGMFALSSSPGKLKISDLIVETDDSDMESLMTDVSLDGLHVLSYLDSTESRSALLGGNYRLALLPVDNGFDLIYLDGARVNAAAWRSGMRKARLVSRGFQNHYLLTWIDATGRPLPGEHYATFDPSEGVLTATFPALNVTLRFAM